LAALFSSAFATPYLLVLSTDSLENLAVAFQPAKATVLVSIGAVCCPQGLRCMGPPTYPDNLNTDQDSH
jgi:hypothetical protein